MDTYTDKLCFYCNSVVYFEPQYTEDDLHRPWHEECMQLSGFDNGGISALYAGGNLYEAHIDYYLNK